MATRWLTITWRGSGWSPSLLHCMSAPFPLVSPCCTACQPLSLSCPPAALHVSPSPSRVPMLHCMSAPSTQCESHPLTARGWRPSSPKCILAPSTRCESQPPEDGEARGVPCCTGQTTTALTFGWNLQRVTCCTCCRNNVSVVVTFCERCVYTKKNKILSQCTRDGQYGNLSMHWSVRAPLDGEYGDISMQRGMGGLLNAPGHEKCPSVRALLNALGHGEYGDQKMLAYGRLARCPSRALGMLTMAPRDACSLRPAHDAVGMH